MTAARAYARTALAGNPSDGYGGAVLAATFANFRAEVRAELAAATRVEPASALVAAAAARFGRGPAELRWRNEIPQAVGLGSSSGLAIAALRALAALHRITLEDDALAELAHAVERNDLGIAGGRQDQVVQSYEGLLFMDFAQSRYERLDSELLPPLVVAYRPEAAQDSSVAHEQLRARVMRKEPGVLAALADLGELARTARTALLDGDHDAFAHAVDATFDARARLMALDLRHVEMVERARACGASGNYCGSGGAVVCVCRDAEHQAHVAKELAAAGRRTLVPQLT